MAVGGGIWKALALAWTVVVVLVLTTVIWLLGDKDSIDEFVGDWRLVPDGLAALPESQAGSGRERGSAACEDRTRHGEGQ